MSSRHLQRLAVTPPSEDSDNVQSGSRYTGRLSSSSNQQSPDAPLRAHRACEKCTRTKKKCDKGLPACSRCTRLATNCCYDFVVNPPSLTLVDHGAASHHYKPTGDGRSAFEWLNQVDFTAAQIMQLMAASNVNWRASVDTFFNTVNTWLVIIHPDVWQRRCAEAQLDTNTTDPDLALVVLCIHLLTMWNCDEFSSTAMLEHPLYQTAKRIWTLRKAFSKPKIEHIQCGILLSLFELGHGDITRCYQSVGEAASISKVLNLRPGKYVKEEEDLPADPEEEQNRALWWSLVIVDKISHEQSCTLWAPLQMDMPSEDDLLPTEHWLWDNEKGATVKSVKRYPVQIPASIRVGAFQRSCQAAILIGYAANWVLASAEQEEPPNVYSFIQLESAARNLIEALITRSETWGENLNTYALCASLFSLLFYSFTYSANSPNTLSWDPETDMQMKKAIAGINFTIGLVIDGSNGIFNAYRNQEEVLEHCAPVWPYAQYHAMQLLFHYEAVLEDGETRTAHLRQSVETTAKRWACSREFSRRQHAVEYLLTRIRPLVGGIRQSPRRSEKRCDDVQKVHHRKQNLRAYPASRMRGPRSLPNYLRIWNNFDPISRSPETSALALTYRYGQPKTTALRLYAAVQQHQVYNFLSRCKGAYVWSEFGRQLQLPGQVLPLLPATERPVFVTGDFA